MACSANETSSSSSRSGATESSTSCWNWRKALSAEVKLFRGFAFAFTIVFTLLLLLSFYLFYLRIRRLQRRTPHWSASSSAINVVSTEQAELGLKKELREMLPVIVFKESFSVTDTLCSVCLGDYEAEDRLQQIPACKHAFHVECIDHWLSSHTTCPLCRLSLLASSPTEPETTNEIISTNMENTTETSPQIQNCGQSSTNPELTQ
ncbi:RING-H2 finger protein ATL58-like [Cynara cardunculus var. scolymus]|uniref:RING-type E3 ubiquitin transferase n=1 Tax=Cynara cardunculus var. scolymus TaxID=59895 RepID=A0A118JZH5_CYNCS|nr:RING-H2 finger protein ATL58-like [Cynara cardunculus var. scolymus]KVH99492.1 Zinc finger, RING/FYVE/PHD-type [Cynara cardunculus var. scolymus]